MGDHRGWTPLPNGTRVRHSQHTTRAQRRNGTGNIHGHVWNHGGRWLEYKVRADVPAIQGRAIEQWSADHTEQV